MKTLLFVLTLLHASLSFGQVFQNWVVRYNGSGNGGDLPTALKVDQNENLYVTGKSFTSGNLLDYATIRYGACGNVIWTRLYHYGDDDATDLGTDASGNVYVTGNLFNQFAFHSIGTIKYNSSGTLQWDEFLGGPVFGGNTTAIKMFVDASGNCYITGLTRQSSLNQFLDVITVKYNSSGQLQWQKFYNGPGQNNDQPEAITVDSDGNTYVTGGSYGNGTDFDYFVLKYGPGGAWLWNLRYEGEAKGPDAGYAIDVDNEGNVYVTGVSKEYEIPQQDGPGQSTFTTIMYDNSGVQQWVKKYFGTGEVREAVGKRIKTLNSNEIFVTGYAKELGHEYDFVTIKYDGSGNEFWISKYNGSANLDDFETVLGIDNSGNAFVTGQSRSGLDPATADYATVKYNTSGTLQWVKVYNGTANDEDVPSAISSIGGVVYVTGKSKGSGSSYDYATIRYSNQWITCPVESMINNLNAVHILNRDTAFVVGNNGKITFTYDKGKHWGISNSGTNNNLRKVKFLNNYGIAIGENSQLLKTTNNGLNWNRLEIPQLELKDIFFLNSRLSIISCSNGRFLKSNNFWNTWNVQNTNITDDIVKVFFNDSLKW